MKKIFILILILCLLSCKRHIPKRPFVIMDKERNAVGVEYMFIDSAGIEHYFHEDKIEYKIGDTIK